MWAGFILGFLGSLHCLGMCGPLIISLPFSSKLTVKNFSLILLYHSGRFMAYGLLGLFIGIIGAGLKLILVQQWVSIITGILLLLAVISHFIGRGNSFSMKLFGKVRKLFQPMLLKKKFTGVLASGMINGFLPCGLVYFAAFSALALASASQGFFYMILFGLGTLPTILAVHLSRNFLVSKWRFNYNKWMYGFVFIMAIWFLFRGMGLGIPYVSPAIKIETAKKEAGACCIDEPNNHPHIKKK